MDSYGDLECFRSYEMLLDIQRLFKESSGGLSGVAEVLVTCLRFLSTLNSAGLIYFKITENFWGCLGQDKTKQRLGATTSHPESSCVSSKSPKFWIMLVL